MQIPPYAQKILSKAIIAIRSCEPVSFIGMYDSGTNYMFSMLIPLADAEFDENNRPIYVDLSGVTNEEEIVKAITQELSNITKLPYKINKYNDLYRLILKIANNRRLTICFNIGFNVKLDADFYFLLNRLRNLLGWNFSYLIFANTGLITQTTSEKPILAKLLRRNICPIIPYDLESAKIVVASYEKRYNQKLKQKTEAYIIKLSGGNPGLIKGLYLQASENDHWKKPNIYDERLYFRLQRIIEDLPKDYFNTLKQITLGKKIKNIEIKSFLKTFGFINKQGKIFSSLLEEFISVYRGSTYQQKAFTTLNDLKNSLLTRSERLVLKYLADNKGQIITRDKLAQILWGENWADKYSDWAIDQLIHTLRKKLSKIKTVGIVKTKKGEGFVYILSEKE